jgi:TolB-like protein/DNA-binding winged helix-turn-helix (wHTH) protein
MTVVYVMGDLCVDAGRRAVLRGSEEITLPKRSFELLLALVEAAPNAVSIDEFMDRVWPGMVVSPETVSQRVKLLRDALGDDPKSPRYVAGIRGHGYRAIPSVSRKELTAVDSAVMAQPRLTTEVPAELPAVPDPMTDVAGELPPAAAEIPPPTARGWSRKFSYFGVAALALLASGAIILLWHRPASKTVLVVGTPARAVAVLPFDNLSADPGDDYIALGLSEMVLNRLSGITSLRVIARTSAFALRGQRLDVHELGRKLNARYLVEGTVQHAASQLRVTAQIIDVDTGREFSAVHIDKPLDAIFDLQDEIADHVAASLAVRTGDASKFKPEQARNAKMAAYLEYLRGRAFVGHWRLVDMEAAVTHFKKAIEIDPQFAAAYSSLATAEQSVAQDLQQDDDASRTQIGQLIDKALSLDDELGEAYIERGDFNSERDPAAAEADFRKGLSLSPSDALGFSAFAESLNQWHRPEEAKQMLEHAIAIDPLAPRPLYIKALINLVPDLEHDREFEASMEAVLRLDPDYTNALVRLADAKSFFRGEYAEAAKLVERALRVDPDPVWVRDEAMLLYLGAGEPIAAKNVIEENHPDPWAGRMTMALYGGDWRQAADLVFNAPSNIKLDRYDFRPILAIELYGYNTRQFEKAIGFLRSAYRLPPGGEVDADNFDAAMAVVILLKGKGDSGGARTLANSATKVDALDSAFAPAVNRVRAYLVGGQYDLAFEELAKCTHAARFMCFSYGWTLPMDPLWNPLRADPRFQAMYRQYIDDTATQHQLLTEMRRKGEVPLRGELVPALTTP